MSTLCFDDIDESQDLVVLTEHLVSSGCDKTEITTQIDSTKTHKTLSAWLAMVPANKHTQFLEYFAKDFHDRDKMLKHVSKIINKSLKDVKKMMHNISIKVSRDIVGDLLVDEETTRETKPPVK